MGGERGARGVRCGERFLVWRGGGWQVEKRGTRGTRGSGRSGGAADERNAQTEDANEADHGPLETDEARSRTVFFACPLAPRPPATPFPAAPAAPAAASRTALHG